MTVLTWFLWRRWRFMICMKEHLALGYQPRREITTLSALHNNNVAGCRKHPIIYNDMCRIVGGGK